jgi:hypothetical protein
VGRRPDRRARLRPRRSIARLFSRRARKDQDYGASTLRELANRAREAAREVTPDCVVDGRGLRARRGGPARSFSAIAAGGRKRWGRRSSTSSFDVLEDDGPNTNVDASATRSARRAGSSRICSTARERDRAVSGELRRDGAGVCAASRERGRGSKGVLAEASRLGPREGLPGSAVRRDWLKVKGHGRAGSTSICRPEHARQGCGAPGQRVGGARARERTKVKRPASGSGTSGTGLRRA